MSATMTTSGWTQWVESGGCLAAGDTDVPVLPALAGDVVTLALDRDVSALRLARVVSKDQVLATRVLRLANSAYCAPMQEITTVNDAVVRMGTAAVRSVVLAVCFASRLHEDNIYGLEGRLLVDHGIGAAYLARVVAERAGVDPDEAFMYGLLHDVGKLVVLKLAADFVRQGGAAPTDAELGAITRKCHATFGAELLRRWRVPPVLEQPVRHHHAPRACERYSAEADVAYAANLLSHRYGFGCPPADTDAVPLDPICQELGLNAAWLDALDQRAPGLFEVARHIVS